ncbi:MAG TPA: RDD family protein [archaeon]|nr:RDD family protein [archaeon]
MLPTRYASFLKRFVAHVVDVLFASMIAGFLVLPFILLQIPGIISRLHFVRWKFFGVYDPESVFELLKEALPFQALFYWAFVFIVAYWLYFAVFESSPRQATPGKMMLGIFVTDLYGYRISFWRALGRTLGKVLSKMLCYLGYLLALVTDRSQALHDLIAGTLVLEPDYGRMRESYPAGSLSAPGPPETYTAGPGPDNIAPGA